MFKKISLPFLAFLQTTGLVVYISLLAVFFTFVGPNLNANKTVSIFVAPIIMLTLFVMSAIISATMVLGRAAVLFWEKRYKECFEIVKWTVIWGFMYLVLFVSYLMLVK